MDQFMRLDRAKHAVLPITKFQVDADHPPTHEAETNINTSGSVQAARAPVKYLPP